MEGTRVTLAAATYTSLEATIDALGSGEILITSALADLDVGLVTASQTPSALPEINDANKGVRVFKPHESVLEVWAHSIVGGDIYIKVFDNALIMDTTGVTSA